jgi:alkylhydroperoxidase family enzyme
MEKSIRDNVVARILEGEGTSSKADRKAAFANEGVPEAGRALIDKVAKNAYRVTDEDVKAAKAAGLSEDAIFELTVCAAIGQATRQIDNALAALDEATKERA